MKKTITLWSVMLLLVAMLLTACGEKQMKVSGTLASYDGMNLTVTGEDGNTYEITLTDDTELLSSHQPEIGDDIVVEYKEEDGALVAVKATVN